MKKKTNEHAWYSIELAQMYEDAAHQLACSNWPHDLTEKELDEFERLEWLSEIWDETSYSIKG